MLKKFLSLLLIGTMTLSIVGCANNNQTKYEIEKTTESTIESTTDIPLENILKDSLSTLELSKNNQNLDMSDLLLTNVSEEKQEVLSDIINPDKPTIIFMTSAYCGTCEEIDYSSILSLNSDVNVIFATYNDTADKDVYTKKGIYNQLYTINSESLVNNFLENKETLNDKYLDVFFEIGVPSCMFINTDNTFSFIVNGTKQSGEIQKYLKFIK